MVYIVGAGPGDPELITVKGQRLLKEADVIIYAGSLVNPALLDYAKADCQIYNSASMTLGDVIETITSAVQEGKMVVRLHTGDPAIYGAIQEQMDELSRRGIERIEDETRFQLQFFAGSHQSPGFQKPAGVRSAPGTSFKKSVCLESPDPGGSGGEVIRKGNGC